MTAVVPHYVRIEIDYMELYSRLEITSFFHVSIQAYHIPPFVEFRFPQKGIYSHFSWWVDFLSGHGF